MTIKNRQLEDAPRKYSGSSAPLVGASEGSFYTKSVAGRIEAFFVDSTGTEIQLTSVGKVRHDPAVVGEANTTSNAGSIGEGLAKPKVGVDLPFKRIKAGTNITLNSQTDYLEINANFPPAVGEANTSSNIGLSGVNVFKQKTGVNFEFRKIKAGNNVVITQTVNDEIQIDAVGGGGGGGEANTASNLGSAGNGYGVFSQKVGVDLQFKRIKAGTNISITDEGNDLLISATGGGAGEANTASNVGAGAGLFKIKSGLDLQFKSLIAGSNITLTPGTDTVTINATGGGSGETNTASNLGTGTAFFAQKSGVDLQFKSLKVSGSGLSISSTSTEVTITATGAGSGDMLKSVYDTNDDGVVNNSAQLNGQAASFYLSRANHTGTQAAGTITGLATVATTGSYSDLSNKPTIPTNLDSLTDVTAPSPSNGQVLQWNGSAWVNATISGGSGEANTASNLGTGSGVFAQKSGVDLQFKSLKAGTNVTLSATATEVTINASGGGGGGHETQILSFDSGNIVIKATGSTADLASVTATKDFSDSGISKLVLNKPTTVTYSSAYVTFTAAETTGRTSIELHCPDLNGATSASIAVRPFAIRFNGTYGIGATASTFSLVSGTTFKTGVAGYTGGQEQKASFLF